MVPQVSFHFVLDLNKEEAFFLKNCDFQCVTAQIFSRLTVLDDVLHLLPDSERQVAQVSWHMNQSSRSHLWIRL